jgi:ABC-type iron transport system FetAB ATPase subunit
MQTGLLERAHELERIDAFLALAQADSGDILLITGPAGIGKSEASRDVRELGFLCQPACSRAALKR